MMPWTPQSSNCRARFGWFTVKQRKMKPAFRISDIRLEARQYQQQP